MPGANLIQQAWNDTKPRLRAIEASLPSPSSSSKPVQRVGQLDAELLDSELVQVLKEPLLKSLDNLGSKWRSLLDPELTLIIQLVVYKFSMWNQSASYGGKLQGLCYRQANHPFKRLSRELLLFHGTLTLILPYAHSRFRAYALSGAWPDAPSFSLRRKLWKLVSFSELLHGVFGVMNFLLFLWNGRYRTLVDRLLGLRLYPTSSSIHRNVSYEFMNRQMVWHAFTEFLIFFLPIINTRRIRRNVLQAIKGIPILSLVAKQTGEERSGRYSKLPEDQCAICAEDASFDIAQLSKSTSVQVPIHPLSNPYTTTCGHHYCYTCIADRLLRAADEGDDHWDCIRCETRVKGANRMIASFPNWQGDEEGTTSDMFELDELSSDHTFETLSSAALSD